MTYGWSKQYTANGYSLMRYETLSTAARKLGIPEPTLRGLEARGCVPKFQRDAAGRRLISESDLEAVQRYLTARRQTSHSTPPAAA